MTGKTLPDRSRCLSWREISQSDETFIGEVEYGFTIGVIEYTGALETIWKFMDQRLTATAGGRYDTFDVETVSTP